MSVECLQAVGNGDRTKDLSAGIGMPYPRLFAHGNIMVHLIFKLHTQCIKEVVQWQEPSLQLSLIFFITKSTINQQSFSKSLILHTLSM